MLICRAKSIASYFCIERFQLPTIASLEQGLQEFRSLFNIMMGDLLVCEKYYDLASKNDK